MGWYQDDGAPPRVNGNPGRGSWLRMAFANGERSWVEQANLLDLLEEVLAQREQGPVRKAGWIELADSDFLLVPQIVEARPIHKKGAQTVTTIQIHHPALTRDGIFEFQHSTGDNLEVAIRGGFEQWAQGDLVTLQDAAREKPETCMTLLMDFPATNEVPARKRRAVLGPPAHLMLKPPQDPASKSEHPFCPCCLLTNSFEAFKPLLEADGFYAIRLFAARDAEGKPQADCRVNGEDFPSGAEALRNYVLKWPQAGCEFRKQYVTLQTIGAAGSV